MFRYFVRLSAAGKKVSRNNLPTSMYVVVTPANPEKKFNAENSSVFADSFAKYDGVLHERKIEVINATDMSSEEFEKSVEDKRVNGSDIDNYWVFESFFDRK